MSDRETARLHADTPQLSVRSSTGAQAASLRLLRQSQADTPRILRHRTHTDEISRTVREYGPRPLRTSEGGPTLADATVHLALGGQTLALHSVDGDTSLALVDGAGRPLWTCNAQGTRHWHDYERPEQGARRHALFEQAAAGLPRMRERLIYAPVTDAQRARNRAGAVMEHFDDAGLTRTVALALTGQPLEQRQCLLQVQVDQPDWTEGPEDDLETDVHTALCDYDATGELLNRTDAVGLTRSIERDISGAVYRTRLRQGDREALALADATRSADGKVVKHESGNGVVDHYRYSPLDHRLIQHHTARPADHPLGYLLISDLHYRYDPVGNLLELDDQGADPQWHGNQRTDGLREYAYDTLYRLIDASGRERTPVAGYGSPAFGAADRQGGSVWTPYREHYVYDDGDNLTTLVHNGGSGQRSRQLRVSTHSNRALPEGHGLTPDTGFFAGGLQKQTVDGRALTWRTDNQLAEVTLVTRAREAMDDREQYRYADGGTRRRKINTVQVAGAAQTTVTTYLEDCELRIRTRDGQPAAQRHVLISEAEGVRWIQDRVHGKTYLRYAFTDHLGSGVGETDEAGNVVSREEFAPYGESTGLDEPAAEVDGLRRRTQRYAGKELDASGLYYYGWRYYQAGSCRWLSADPSGLVDGVNLYTANTSNPLRYADNDGRIPEDTTGQEAVPTSTESSDSLAPGPSWQQIIARIAVATTALTLLKKLITIIGVYRGGLGFRHTTGEISRGLKYSMRSLSFNLNSAAFIAGLASTVSATTFVAASAARVSHDTANDIANTTVGLSVSEQIFTIVGLLNDMRHGEFPTIRDLFPKIEIPEDVPAAGEAWTHHGSRVPTPARDQDFALVSTTLEGMPEAHTVTVNINSTSTSTSPVSIGTVNVITGTQNIGRQTVLNITDPEGTAPSASLVSDRSAHSTPQQLHRRKNLAHRDPPSRRASL
ncbi:RHS repeat-associated core domain-containing protein [Pseudomonas sp. RAC1]|uniref:RHS repeat-associated core domain-containing protein n=1 Tax=Pseudomonas sp. RAC1 TaxID=3064900 RepID=UPI002728B340|nr:RHS repeat-associated core domain-containing protein [Pseudomonas sp. RAC1]MDV9034158.1 RHS repeat-associated core domain-containing protein [Pseudomonas sp. RAC1]